MAFFLFKQTAYTNCKNNQYRPPDKQMVAGSVNTHAERIVFTVLKFRPDLLATIVPATALFKTCVVETGIPKPSAAAIVLIATSSADIP